jgi:hypothetical protein
VGWRGSKNVGSNDEVGVLFVVDADGRGKAPKKAIGGTTGGGSCLERFAVPSA